jgi:leucyl/phenylalanyl-tRNA---protein transferase
METKNCFRRVQKYCREGRIKQSLQTDFGQPGGDRTPDPQLRRLMLYPTELRAEIARKKNWSGRKDSNLRPSGPKPDALPGCATPRLACILSATTMRNKPSPLVWLEPGQDFPPVSQSWGNHSTLPGLLAAGGALDVTTLQNAYSQGIFPWFSQGQPILWWSPDPRMVLQVANFKLHASFRKTLQKFIHHATCEIRVDTAFDEVISACAGSLRAGEAGTWILPEMVQAYQALHRAGFAHSMETWINGQLCGGLYCVCIGKAVFGESMFMRQPDASKIALAALVSFCRHHGIELIDCQQNTRHMASLGAHEVERSRFLSSVTDAITQTPPSWHFEPLYWRELLKPQTQ